MHRVQRLFERQRLQLQLSPGDFRAVASGQVRYGGPPVLWLPLVRALDDSSRAFREVLDRLVCRSW